MKRALLAVALLAAVGAARAQERPRGDAPRASGTAPVASAHPLEKRYAAAAALRDPTERAAALRELSIAVPIADQAELLAWAPPPPLSPAIEAALDGFCERRAEARSAALARLEAQNECGPPLFFALVRLWDGGGHDENRIEKTLVERLATGCRDHAANLDALAARGTRSAVPAIVDVLFFSPEKEGLTFRAQLALRAIAKRDSAPDEALEPLIAHVQPGWPGPEELVRRRDVLLAMGGSTGAAVPFLVRTLATLERNDLDPRGDCWRSLARIGTRDAVLPLVRELTDEKLADARLEERRIALVVEALGEAERAAPRADFLLGVADAASALRADQRASLLAVMERLTRQRFGGDVEALRRLGRQVRDKER